MKDQAQVQRVRGLLMGRLMVTKERCKMDLLIGAEPQAGNDFECFKMMFSRTNTTDWLDVLYSVVSQQLAIHASMVTQVCRIR